MKELSIEQKAQRYDEAFGMAKKWYNAPNINKIPTYGNRVIEEIFPELKEENEDEKIRNNIKKVIGWYRGMFTEKSLMPEEYQEIDAWLEKQCEKETDEWKEGNIIKHGDILALVIKGRRAMKSNGEIFTVQYPDEWVKALPIEIELFFNEFEKQGNKPQGKSAIEAINEEKIDNANKVEPRFKVGDFIQFNGMGHTRYTVKEVCGLSHYINTCNKRMDMSYTDANFELVEQKNTEWSEEDEEVYRKCICAMRTSACGFPEEEKFVEQVDSWLKSLKERVQPQSQWKPSREQMVALNCAITAASDNFVCLNVKDLESLYEQLKKLREE